MSKKLLIAVLTLGLLFTLGGVVWGTDDPGQRDRMPLPRTNPDAPLYNNLNVLPQFSDQFYRPAPEPEAITPTSLLPPPYFCEFIDYSGGAAAYYQEVPTTHPVFYQNMRFTPAEGYACTLLTAYIGTYSPGFVGTPDMEVLVWDDDGTGFPGTVLASVTVPNASLPVGIAYAVVDFSSFNLVFTDGEEFHIGVNCPNSGTGNVLAILMDDGTVGTGRHSIWYDGGGFWTTWTTDYNYLMGVDLCCADLPYSYCYRQEYNCNVYYYVEQPDAWGDDYYNMRMTVEGAQDTLKAVGVALYFSDGTPDMDVFVWGSDAGFPDMADVIFQTTVAYGDLVYYPDYVHVTVPDIIVRSDFHVGWSTNDVSGGTLAGLTDDGSCGTMRGSTYYDGMFQTNLDVFGLDLNFLIYADICKDEFSVCDNIFNTTCDPYWVYSLPSSSGSGRIACFEKIEPLGIGCRLEKMSVALYTFGDPWNFTFTSDLVVYDTDVDDLPGNLLASLTIGPGTGHDYVLFPGYCEFDLVAEGVQVLFDEPIWIGIKTNHPDPSGATDPIPDYYVVGDDDGCNMDHACVMYDDGTFVRYTGSHFYMHADVCCVPVAERPCEAEGPFGPDEDWVTSGHDFRRTAASDNGTGNAKCAQTLSWMHNDLAGFIYGRPIIYDGMVMAPYNDKLQAFDIGTGALIWTATGLPEMGSSFRNSVTCKDGFVYYGGGNGRSFTKADAYTGVTVWSRNVLNNPFAGNTIYTTSIILDCDGTEVVYLGTTAGELYALDAGTGANYGGWAVNPLMLDGDPQHTLSSNGVDVLYVGTNGAFGTGYGTLYAVDACTGAILWSLGDGDLCGHDLDGGDGTQTTEIFQGPIGVDLDGSLYVQSAFDAEVSGTPSAAVYRISSGGVVEWCKGFQFPRFTGPVIDAALVYHTGLRGWTSEGENGTFGFKKSSGAQIWQADEAFNAMNWNEGALSCELQAPDLLYVGNMDAQFLCINGDDGTVEFEYNYVATGSNRGCGAAIDNTHVVFNNRQGDLYVFTEQVDRPRLRLLRFDEFVSVPFFSPPNYIVTYEDVFMNNGCANLTGTLSADESPSAAYAWTVNPERISRMQKAADGMVDVTYSDMARNLVKRQPVDPSTLDAEYAESPYAKDSYSNMGAYGPPAWLNNIQAIAFDLGPGEAFDVVYDVNGPLVTRGPHRCYVTISSNDAYYLNDPGDPQVQLGVLGGCLQSFDVLHFGAGGGNEAPVHNTGEVGNQNGEQLWLIDGNDGRYWQGGFFYAADTYRLAWTTDSWHGGDPPDFWNSLLPDPNCFDQCEPYVTPDPVLLGAISNDGGFNYDDIYGYVAAYAYIDSVVNFDCYLTGWDWANVECPFDNALTIGLRVEEFMYGVIDVPELNNVVIYRHDITNRNVDPVEFYLGAFHDFDLDGSWNGFDTWKYSDAYGIAYGTPCAPAYTGTVVYGVGTIPMDIMIGSRTCDAQQTMWHADNVALDSMYYWMTNEPGQTAQAGIQIAYPCDPASESDDRDLWASFMGTTIGGRSTLSVGTYFFGYEVADINDDQFFYDLASLINQMSGFDRGDINGDGAVDLADVVALWNMVNAGGPGPRFQHMADVDASGGAPDNADVQYLANYYFCAGPAPSGDWAMPNICP